MRDSEAVIDSAVVTRHDGVRHAVRLKPFVTGHLKREIIEILKPGLFYYRGRISASPDVDKQSRSVGNIVLTRSVLHFHLNIDINFSSLC